MRELKKQYLIEVERRENPEAAKANDAAAASAAAEDSAAAAATEAAAADATTAPAAPGADGEGGLLFALKLLFPFSKEIPRRFHPVVVHSPPPPSPLLRLSSPPLE